MHDFRDLLRDVPKDAKVTGPLRTAVLQRLAEADKRGFVDWITLSIALRFSMKYANNYNEFTADTLYNKLRASDYTADGYLDGLEVVHEDYRDLYRKYRDVPGALFIVDPPYLSTDTSTYRSDKYWTMKDYLDVLTILQNLNYVYFTSDKSQIVELCEWLDANEGKVRNIFQGATVSTVHETTTGSSGYMDIMFYKLHLNGVENGIQ